MKLNEFITEMAKVFVSVKIWEEMDGIDDEMFVYFKDPDDGSIRFVFFALGGALYMKPLMKAMELPFVDDIGITNTLDDEGNSIERAHDMIVVLKEGIEDLEMDTCVGCENCEGCENKTDKKVWN